MQLGLLLKDERGISLVEILVAVSALMIGVVGMMSMTKMTSSQNRDVALKSKVIELKTSLLNTISSQAAWDETVKQNSTGATNRSGTACLKTGTCTNDATTTKRRFALYDANGTLIHDPYEANNGYGRNGVKCTALGIAAANCPVKVDLSWRAACDTDPTKPLSCRYPTEIVNIEFTFADDVHLNAKTLSVMGVARQSLSSETPISRCLAKSPPRFFIGRDVPTYMSASGVPYTADIDGCVEYQALAGPDGPQGPPGNPGPQGPYGYDGPQGPSITYYYTPVPTPAPTATP